MSPSHSQTTTYHKMTLPSYFKRMNSQSSWGPRRGEKHALHLDASIQALLQKQHWKQEPEKRHTVVQGAQLQSYFFLENFKTQIFGIVQMELIKEGLERNINRPNHKRIVCAQSNRTNWTTTTAHNRFINLTSLGRARVNKPLLWQYGALLCLQMSLDY